MKFQKLDKNIFYQNSGSRGGEFEHERYEFYQENIWIW